MKDRIKIIMENENLTPAKFADRLQINRAIVSHILNGRNNPSLDVVTRILTEMNYINPEWLLNGTGEIYKKGVDSESIAREPDLFSQDEPKPDQDAEEIEKQKEIAVKKMINNLQSPVNKIVEMEQLADKKITQIIIYYSNNTFDTFIPHKVKE
ncbi:MAG: helix-turn-helix transcriptional regulator [Bacteroidales bacterium]|jgi:transcriptional regulator with XRE-family HTH domain|nr:helix-turn-helix transcriptional regulator [Bacteroidales bacterium]